MENPVWFSSSDRQCAGIDLEIMHPPKDDKILIAIGKAVCDGCPFISPCLDYALKHHEEGVWGGTFDNDRRNIVRERYKARHCQGTEPEW